MHIDRILFLLAAFATHGAVGYALVRAFTDASPLVGFALAVVPDADFLFPASWGYPFVHRGITHTPALVLGLITIAYAIRRAEYVPVAALALGSHLLVDSLSPAGIPWLFPLEVRVIPSPGIAVHGPLGTTALWALAVAIVAHQEDGHGSLATS